MTAQVSAGDALRDGLVQTSFAIQGVLGALAAEHDLSLAQVRLLGILRDREPSMQELARLLGLEKSSVTGLVDRAERRGLVSRTRSAADGRSVEVKLTDEGSLAAHRFAGQVDDRLEPLLAPLPAGARTQLANLLSALNNGHE